MKKPLWPKYVAYTYRKLKKRMRPVVRTQREIRTYPLVTKAPYPVWYQKTHPECRVISVETWKEVLLVKQEILKTLRESGLSSVEQTNLINRLIAEHQLAIEGKIPWGQAG